MARCLICLKRLKMGYWYDFFLFGCPKAEIMIALSSSEKVYCLIYLILCPEDKLWTIKNPEAATPIIEDRIDKKIKLLND